MSQPTPVVDVDGHDQPDVAEIEALRRRAGELSALYSSARELVAVRDADAVLVRLVERAHEMLGADVTYLSEFDPATGDLHVRATRGAVSAEFRTLVVPAGRGLVSAIAETRLAQAVSRYDDYAQERHDDGVDAAVRAEGIVSMLGVPLLSEDAVLGVLFVSMRQERAFPPEQIALLSALADHASVVVQAAAALRDAQRSEAEAREAVAQLTDHLAARDRANRVHQRLVDAVLGGGVRAAAGQGAAGDAAWHDPAVRAAIDESRATGRAARVDGEPAGVAAALAAGARLFGAVVITGDGPDLDAVDLRTVERAGQVGALLALSEEAVDAASHRQQTDLVVDVLTAPIERRPDVVARVRRAGFDLERMPVLSVFVVGGDRRADAGRLLARAVGAHGLVGELDGLLVHLPGTTDAGASPAELRDALVATLATEILAVTVPLAGIVPAEAFESARRAARLARALGVEDAWIPGEELLPYAAVLDADQRSLAVFLDGAIGAVRRHDHERGSELLATLRAFVRNGASPTRTARALVFHTNTILQRLERLDSVLGEGWRDDERFFRISLAVRLDELRERLVG